MFLCLNVYSKNSESGFLLFLLQNLLNHATKNLE